MQYRKLAELNKLPNNPRTIEDSSFKKLCQSIKDNKDYFEARPLILSDRTGELIIIGGNQRYDAAKKLGLEEVPTYLLKELTEKREKEIIIRDNVANGEWNWEILANDFDLGELDNWGLEVPDLELGDEESEVEEDEVPEVKKDPFVKKGDLWELNEHKLLCGDSTMIDDVDKLMGGEKADLFLSDPPYGVSYTDKNEYLNSLGAGDRLTKAIENDHKAPEEMKEFWDLAFANACISLKDDSSYYIFAPQGGDLLLLLQAVRDSGFQLKHILIWAKNNHVLGRCDYHYKHEPIVYGWKQKGKHNFYGKGQKNTSVWDFDKPLKNDLHPTMKPITVLCEALLNSTKKDDLIIDFFLGSGSTLIACEQTKRKCYGMELDEHYCSAIITRWLNYMIKEGKEINLKCNGETIDYKEV